MELNRYYWYNHNQLGSGYYYAGHLQDALKEFNEQVVENPSEDGGYLNIGSVYLQLGQWDKAIQYLQKALSIRPSVQAYSNLGTAYYDLGRYQDAIPMYQKALALEPAHAAVMVNLAGAYARTGQPEMASETYNRAITLLYQQLDVNPQDSEKLGLLASCYAAQRHMERARIFITRALKIDPDDRELLYTKATIDAIEGNVAQGLTDLRKAFENGYPFRVAMNDPDIARLRAAPGFKELRKKFGR